MGDRTRPPRQSIEETQRQLEDQLLRESEEREPWELDRSWREKVPGYDLLRARGLPNKLIYRLLHQRKRALALWDRTATIKLPESKHQMWTEKSLAIQAVSCGWDDGVEDWQELVQTRALIESWWELHGLTPEPLNFRLVLPEALRYTEKARHEVAERRQQAVEERESGKTYYLIGSFLSDLGRPATLQEIITETGLLSGTVRRQLSRMVRRTEECEREEGYFREGRGVYSFRKRGSN
jgi:hypothetical protein